MSLSLSLGIPTMTTRLTFAPASVSPSTPLARRLECVAHFPYTLLEMLEAEGGAAARCGLFSNWTDAHIPRTPAPLRFHHVVAFYWQDGTLASPRKVWTMPSRIVS